MAKKKPKPPKVYPTPPDYISGSKKPGEKYKTWERIPGRRKPDLGKGSGPGIPYTTIEKKVTPTKKPPAKPKPPPKLITGGRPNWPQNVVPNLADARVQAIRRRMGG